MDEHTSAVQARRRSNAAGPHGHRRPRASEHEFWQQFYAEEGEPMDGEEHYRMAMDLVAETADPDPADQPRVQEFLLAANVHMTAALVHALAPDLAKKWSTP